MLILYGFLSLSIGLGASTCGRLLVLLRRFRYTDTPELPSQLEDLPTISVCIPARNETHAMTQCLERVIASTYPKLEIIVLDDNSADNTSVLIKSFAHAGVRFVEGAPLPDGWLGKTHAQQELYHEASGQYILFLDVDTHLAPQSIDQLVAISLTQDAPVVSILPTRDDVWRASVLFATLRHFWSVITHTRRHPAASSSALFVKRSFLRDTFEGFTSLQSAVAPERNIARYAATHARYRFFISTPAIGVSYEKKWSSQCETSIRLLFPFFGGHIVTALLGLSALWLALLPFIILPFGIGSWLPIHSYALVGALLLLLGYLLYTRQVWRAGWLVGGLFLPAILLQECILLIKSMYAYATSAVTWKGRPIRHSAKRVARG